MGVFLMTVYWIIITAALAGNTGLRLVAVGATTAVNTCDATPRGNFVDGSWRHLSWYELLKDSLYSGGLLLVITSRIVYNLAGSDEAGF